MSVEAHLSDSSCTSSGECVHYERYVCAGCKRWRPWWDGAADDHPHLCNACCENVQRKVSAMKSPPFSPVATHGVLHELLLERVKQHRKWGAQSLPSVDPVLAHRRAYPAERMAMEYEIPAEHRAKFLCETA
jgi:predicted amidophosphoribosyltransferase